MIDELNNLVKYNNKINDVDAWMNDFFGVMEIDEEQKEKRKKVEVWRTKEKFGAVRCIGLGIETPTIISWVAPLWL